MSIVTRFAPSPTGFLHIGGARTALFNWLLARHFGGKFLLRIEDTDRVRSTQEAVDKIFAGLKWLNIDWDEEPVFQFSRCDRHVALAKKLVEQGKAYYCYCTPDELVKMREDAKALGKQPRYNGYWRDRDLSEAPKGVNPVIRLKSPRDGTTVLDDIVQGSVKVSNEQLDDMILVRSDGTPTFMLSVVVDDHDMGVTTIVRGDDHLTNTFRQMHIFEAFGWAIPQYGHIPLIHGPDGAKLSKRHGALGVESYQEMGFLPEAICNYLLRLGWSHGDDEIITQEQAIKWFTMDNVGKSASRFDFAKLTNLNAHYIRESSDDRLLSLITQSTGCLPEEKIKRLKLGMSGLKTRAKTVLEIVNLSGIYINDFKPAHVTNEEKTLLLQIDEALKPITDWNEMYLEGILRNLAVKNEINFGKIAQLLRKVLTEQKITPNIFEMLVSFGKEEIIHRICSFVIA